MRLSQYHADPGSFVPSEHLTYRYSGTRPTWDHSIVLPLVCNALTSVPSDGTILDLGCGNGSMLEEIRTRGSWRLHGYETSRSGAEIARSRGFDVSVGDPAANLLDSLAPNSYDLIISIEVIEHVFNPLGLLCQANALLRANGQLLVTTPYHGYLKNLIIAAAGKCDSHYNPLWDCGHIKFWSRTTLSTALAEAGFHRIRFHGTGRVPLLWKSMILTAQKPS